MPGPDAEVPVQGTGGLVADPDHPGPAALAAHGDLPPPQVDVAAPRVARVIRDPGQFLGPDPFSRGPQPVARRCAKCFAESFCNTSPWMWCSLSLLL